LEHLEALTNMPCYLDKSKSISQTSVSTIEKEIPIIVNQELSLKPYETLTSTPFNLKKSISLSQSTISSISFHEDMPKIVKLHQNFQPGTSVNYEASDEDIYTESFPTNTNVEEDVLFRPLYKYLGVFVVDPDDYTRNYESELVEFEDLSEFFQAIQPPPGYFDISINETNT